MLFGRTIKNIGRAREIIGILLKYGFEDLVANTPLIKLVPKKRQLSWMRSERPALEFSRWERIRLAAEEMGASFIKLAQVLSNRPDILPEPLLLEFQKLQNEVPPFDIEILKSIVESETGKQMEEVFSYFENEPLGSASIGQVHRATLLNGDQVVVKVRRPGVKDLIETDLAILKELARRGANYFEKNGILNIDDVISTFEKSIRKELDFKNEARSLDQFRVFYKKYKEFYSPKPYKALSSERVLVMEFIDACKITNTEQIRKWGHRPEKIAEIGMDVYLRQIFEYGYFHADPHPGNVLIRKDGVICLIDFGMMGKLMQKDKYAFAGIFISMSRLDAKGMALNLRRLALEDEITDIRTLEYDLNELIENFALLDVSESSIAEMIAELQQIMFKYKLKIPGSVFLIFRALGVLEGIGKQLHPNFKTYEFVKPYGRKIIQEQFSVKNISEEIYYRLTHLYTFFNAIPIELKEILKMLRKGKLHIETHNTGWEPLAKSLQQAVNRLILCALIFGVLMASSLLALAPTILDQGTYLGLPLISILGFLLAGFLTFILLTAIIRHR